MKRLIGIIATALILAAATRGQAASNSTNISTARPPTSMSATPTPDEIAKSSVRIDVFVEERGRSVLVGHGSGTIIAADGQILTNAHVVAGADELIINLTSSVDLPPTPTYYAELIEIDYVLDLALLQITTDIDGNAVERSELDLQVLELGDSDDIGLGERIRVFGYPGYGRETVTFTQGTVSGFESDDLGNGSERIWIKTDTDISYGNSGGTAVDDRGLLVGIPTAGVASEMETLGYLRPINVAGYPLSGLCAPYVCGASIYEPNYEPSDPCSMAYGPLDSQIPYTAYIHQDDVDVYRIEARTLDLIDINLTDIADDVDYDLGLLPDTCDGVLAISEGEASSSEHIVYSPTATGTYHIVVAPYYGYSLQEPYVLQAAFDGDSDELVPVTVRGRVLDANTGRPIEGAVIAILLPGVTGEQFMDNNLAGKLVEVSSVTDVKGIFTLEQVPRGATYTGFITTAADFFWQDDWLTVGVTGPDDIDVGDIQLSIE